ncbi:MAG: DUF4242 domain-containing protein [Anaerolineales bacterium]|jgi:hypothetical protein
MHHFLVIHTVKQYPETQDEWLELWEGIIKNLCGDVRWLSSYYDPADERLYCLWEAETEAQIHSCFTEEGVTMAPIEEIREVAFFDIQEMSTNLT